MTNTTTNATFNTPEDFASFVEAIWNCDSKEERSSLLSDREQALKGLLLDEQFEGQHAEFNAPLVSMLKVVRRLSSMTAGE